jgi:DNA-binding NtrC family response regulator
MPTRGRILIDDEANARAALSEILRDEGYAAETAADGFKALGGNETQKVDMRVIAATNKNLGAEIKRGQFREDLFYRLNVVAVELPPLRERHGDIAPLASFFLARYAMENGKQIVGVDVRCTRALPERGLPSEEP